VNVAYGPEVTRYLRNLEQDGGELQPIELSEDYLKEGGAICERRVVEAGYRLGAVLKQLVE
jgi:hypothetical protein